jgi:cysteine desulfurase
VGKVPVDVRSLGVDLLAVAGHKLYAPKGVGALYLRRGVQVEPQVRGAGHERGLRAGTENLIGIVGLGTACELVTAELARETPRLTALRDRLEARLRAGHPDLVVHGHPERRLPNTASVSFPGVDAGRLLALLADTVAVSAGAACHGDQVRASHVLQAMGVPAAVAMGTLRLSVGRFSTEGEVDRGAELVLEAVRQAAAGG